MTKCILFADDTEDMRLLLRTVFDGSEFEVFGEAADGDEALRLWRTAPPSCALVLDQRMPGRTGIEVAREVLADAPDTTIILFSAHMDDELRREAAAVGIRACVAKEAILTLPHHPVLQH